MTIAAYIALFGWIPTVFILFALLPGRHAAAAAVIGAWLLLPPYAIPISNFPDYSKNTAASLGILLSTLFFGFDRVLAFRPRWFDIPMLLWCLSGLASSLSNDLGPYDGLSDSLKQVLNWGLPYLFGRIYFSDVDGLRIFTVAMIIGGLAYVLPCLWEMRMSPQLLRNIYGISGWHGTRLGGFRPHVFFKTGLELGMWMTAISLAAWWLWRCGVITKFGQFSFGMTVLPILLGTTALCRSTGALILLLVGVLLLWASTQFKTKMLFWVLVFLGPAYVAVRVPTLWSGQQLVDLVEQYVSAERAQSLGYRFMCEDLLIARAVEQPVFGWAGWDRSAVYFDDDYRDKYHMVPTDGLWIAILGTKGYAGLTFWYITMELPVMLFLWRFPIRLWRHAKVAPASFAAAILGLCMVDFIVNGFVNIIYVSLAGGLISITPTQIGVSPRERRGGEVAYQAEGPHRSPDSDFSQPMASLTGIGEVGLAEQFRSLGRISKERGRLDEAQAAWQQSLDIFTKLSQLYPDLPDLQRRRCDCANDLAWLLLNHPDPASRDPASALTLAGQIVEKYSDCKVYWNTLGVAYFRAGDFKAAVASLEHAMDLGSDGNSFDLVFLAMAHARLGNLERARLCLVEAAFHKERNYPDHSELIRFCDEARSILPAVPETPIAARG